MGVSDYHLDKTKKYIVISSCIDCPHKDHRGAIGSIAYIPFCRKNGANLGYTVSRNPELNLRAIATYNQKIPIWCPLPDEK